MVRNRMQGIFSPVPFPNNYTLFFPSYLRGEYLALYQRAKANRACGMIYHRPDVMAERLIDAENGDVVVQMPSVVYGKRQRGGQPGNTNARKNWRKEGK